MLANYLIRQHNLGVLITCLIAALYKKEPVYLKCM